MNKDKQIKFLENANQELHLSLKDERKKNQLLIQAFQEIHEEMIDIKVILKKLEKK